MFVFAAAYHFSVPDGNSLSASLQAYVKLSACVQIALPGGAVSLFC